MKKYLIAAIFFSLSTSTQAFNCENKVEGTHGSWEYTYSKCTSQEPASQEILAIITLIANTIENDKDSESDEFPELDILLPPRKRCDGPNLCGPPLLLDIDELY
ncbi:hypothetical protein N9854_06410 [Amylibacter sp.]|nr:hypothetical protein [Amylibacter sp.]MDB9817280.1 hypothetical protein [Amylibacter sp.]